jgi:hypothetical protein
MSWIEKLAGWFGLEDLRPHGPAEVDEAGVRRRLGDGTLEEVCWEDLEAVMIHTTDEGPFCEDFYWVLFGAAGSGVLVPGERAQEIGLLPILQERLSGMDNEAVIAACGCTEEQWFPVWRRNSGENEEAAAS